MSTRNVSMLVVVGQALFELLRVDRFAQKGRSDLVAAALWGLSPVALLANVVGFRFALWQFDFLFGVMNPNVALVGQVLCWGLVALANARTLKLIRAFRF